MKPKTKAAPNPIHQVAKSARSFLAKGVDLSPADTMSIVVEPALAALGWNTKDPLQMRRQDTTIKLLSSDTETITICVYSLHQDIAKSAARQARNLEGWVILTNGLCWNIFNAAKPGELFKSADLTKAPVAKVNLETLDLLHPDAIAAGSLDQKWSPEAMDNNVAAALLSLLKNSDVLLTATQEELGKTGSDLSKEELQASIERLSISIAPSSSAANESSTPEPKAAKGKPVKAKKATKAKEAPKKVAAKSGSGNSVAKAPKQAAAKDESGGSVAKAPKQDNSGSDTDWPSSATHCMKRRKNIAYISMDAETYKTTLLPGSVITAVDGKALNPPMIEARKQAYEDGKLKLNDDLYEVVEAIEFDNPRLAATFAAGTLVKDISAWLSKDGTPLDNSILSKKKASKSTARKKPAARKATSKKEKLKVSSEVKAEDADNADAEPAEVAAKPREKLKLNFKKTPPAEAPEEQAEVLATPA